MTYRIPDAAVALSLILQALSLLDRPEHSRTVLHLQDAIEELSPKRQTAVSAKVPA